MRLSISSEPDSTPTSSRRSPDCSQRAHNSSGRRTPWSARMVPAQENLQADSIRLIGEVLDAAARA